MSVEARRRESLLCRLGLHHWGCRPFISGGPLRRIPDGWIGGNPPFEKECFRCGIKRPLGWKVGSPWR